METAKRTEGCQLGTFPSELTPRLVGRRMNFAASQSQILNNVKSKSHAPKSLSDKEFFQIKISGVEPLN